MGTLKINGSISATGTISATNGFIGDLTGTASHALYLETWKTNKSSTYGESYPLYAWWETGSICKLVVDNYTTKVDLAEQLTTARTIRTNLASTSTASFDGSANITPGVTGILAIGNGGTGASGVINARYNLLYVNPPVTATTNDTTATWGALGPSTISFYSTKDQLIDQPAQYGLLLNFNNKGSEVHQLWLTQASGDILHRGGNANGWNGSWRVLLDENNYTSYTDSRYVNISGDTMTGTLNVPNVAVTSTVTTQYLVTTGRIDYKNSTNQYQMIRFYAGDSAGAGVSIGGGGFFLAGSGESSTNLIENLSLSGGTEQTYITSDNNITFYSACQYIDSKKGMIYDTGGQLYPIPTDSNLGTANNRWYYLYTQNVNCSNNLAVTNYITCGSIETSSSIVCGSMMTIKGGGLEIFHTTTPYIDFHYQSDSGDYSARIICTGADEIRISGVTSFCCDSDQQASLGRSGKRWSALWASNGTIQTSDLNLKTNINSIDSKYILFFNLLRPVSYQFKGNTHDRMHLGFIAQEVESAMKMSNISDLEFGGYCKDIDKETGNSIYSLRYSEFIALNTFMIQSLQKQINELKKYLNLN